MLKLIGDKKTEQTAGDGGQNIAACRDVVIYQGIDEKRAREIVHEMLSDKIRALSSEAKVEADQRAEIFENKLIEKLGLSENGYDGLKRPEVQFSIIDAKKGYISNAQDESLEISLDLIAEYVGKNDKTETNPIYLKAIEIAPNLNKRLIDVLLSLFSLFNMSFAIEYIKEPKLRYLAFKRDWENLIINNVASDAPTKLELNLLNLYGIASVDSLSNLNWENFCQLHCHNLYAPIGKDLAYQIRSLCPEMPLFEASENCYYIEDSETMSSMISPLNNEVWSKYRTLKGSENSTPPNQESSVCIMESLEDIQKAKDFIQKLNKHYPLTPVGLAISISILKSRGLILDERIWLS